jgi:polysaccharide export outer membrane protein
MMTRMLLPLAAATMLSACGYSLSEKPPQEGVVPAARNAFPVNSAPNIPIDVALADSPLSSEMIGPLDVISVNVYREPDLTLSQVVVDRTGRFEMPLIGVVEAANKTTGSLSTEIRQRLAERFLVNPDVSVNLIASNSKQITVEGSVASPGVFPLQGETTLLGALALAKGPTNVAKLNEIAVFRKESGSRMVAVFDAKEIRAGRMADPVLKPNDIVVVGFNGMAQAFQDFLRTTPLLTLFTRF